MPGVETVGLYAIRTPLRQVNSIHRVRPDQRRAPPPGVEMGAAARQSGSTVPEIVESAVLSRAAGYGYQGLAEEKSATTRMRLWPQ